MTFPPRACAASIQVLLLTLLAAGCGSDSPSDSSSGGSGPAGGVGQGGSSFGGAGTFGGSVATGGTTPSSGGAVTAGGGSTSTGGANVGTGGSAAGSTSAGSGGVAGSSSGGSLSGGNAGALGTTGGAAGAASGGSTTGGTGGTAGGKSGGTGGAATGGQAGAGGATGGSSTGGSGGLPTVPDNGCNVRLTDKPVGFAAGTVGGGNATPIWVSTAADLKTYLADAQPRVLYVMKDLDFRTENRTGVKTCVEKTKCDNGSGGLTDDPRVADSCDAQEAASTSYRYEVTLKVASNKTVIGIGTGSGAALRGASFNFGNSQQVIFRNLKIYDVNPHLVEAGDGITMQGTKNIWLDHLLLAQISDGYVDIGSVSGNTLDDNVTLSWLHYDGRAPNQCGGKHHYVGFVDNGRATLHHNFWDNSSGRNPKLGGASTQVHLFNNYWLNVSYFCTTAQQDAQARVESNYFENSLKPHWLQLDGGGKAGIAIDSGNVYTGASNGSTSRDTGGSVFSVPYTYTKESADAAKASVLKCSGPQPIR